MRDQTHQGADGQARPGVKEAEQVELNGPSVFRTGQSNQKRHVALDLMDEPNGRAVPEASFAEGGHDRLDRLLDGLLMLGNRVRPNSLARSDRCRVFAFGGLPVGKRLGQPGKGFIHE